MNYEEFLAQKRVTAPPVGFEPDFDAMPSALFQWQRDIIAWAIRRGRAALFEDCGMGKTLQQLVWADQVRRHTSGNVLILAPLAVARQTADEATRFGIEANVSRDGTVYPITVTNYELLHKFDTSAFSGVVLDESSILKAYDGKTRTAIIGAFAQTPYRLACTATPAPNDHMELGNHSEFLGVMNRTEMLAMFFTHDGGDTSKWRLKGHAEDRFWEWVASWAVMVRSPHDLGYPDDTFVLPPIHRHDIVVDVAHQDQANDAQLYLFNVEAQTLAERRNAKKVSLVDRVAAAAELVNNSADPWIVWCNLNAEGDALVAAIPDAVQVSGADSAEEKERRMLDFAAGKIRVLVTKPTIAGFGMNWQHCAHMAFVGLSDSYEQIYQAERRCWRFGQKREVNVYVITSELEGAVVRNITRKQADADKMADGMVHHMASLNEREVRGADRVTTAYSQDVVSGKNYTLYLGDCVDMMRSLPENSIDFSVFSPPFSSLYTYSNSDRDMGNCASDEEFYHHYRFLVAEQFRTLKPGRLLSFHCMNLPSTKSMHGHIGMRDFRGDLIRIYQEAGFIYHSEVCIWKDPVTAMQRTKALGLLYKQLKKDSAMSRQGIPDYLVTMRKPGDNAEPVTKDPDEFSVDLWQRYASPVWMDINQSRTLQYRSAKDEQDEKHICPLQLDVIERAITLWSNKGDLVCSPFTGIGSEGYCAVKLGRRFVGSELKPSYFSVATKNLEAAEAEFATPTLFDFIEE